jgi:predicted nucleic acid-binding protein
MSDERILIDTSVWIEYFRSAASRITEKTEKILDEDEVFVPKMVLAELIQGAKSAKEIGVIEGFFGAFHIIDQSDETWLKAALLAYNLKKKGKTIHLSDCYVAVIAKEHDCKIFTLNRHFQEIQSLTDIELI